jgi:hypothetical protein
MGSRNLCTGGSVTLSATGGSSFLWSNGATSQTITTAQAGTYTVTVTSYCGTSASAPYTVNEVAPPTPSVSGNLAICANSNTSLTAANPTGTLVNNWYDANGNFLANGDVFVTPNLISNTTYNVVSTQFYSDTLKASPHSNGIGGGGYVNSSQYEIFNSYTDFTLRSVLVYSQSAGNIVIALQDSTGTDIQSITATVPAGQSRVTLNFAVPIASNLRLTAKSMTVTGLYRNNNSAIYPYNMNGVLSIIGASAGASYFYYFYDWEILNPNGFCVSPQTPVSVAVSACSGLQMEDLQFLNEMKLMPNPNNGEFNVQFNAPELGDATLQVSNLLGQNVYTQNLGQVSGEVQQAVNLNQLPAGVYLMKITYKGKPYVQKFVVQ